MAKSQQKVTVTFLGGVGEIGKNMTVIECAGDMIIVDCGVAFAKEDTPGMDAIIPDVTYIKENIKKLRGIVLTHGHEDHIGAIPYYTDVFKDVPIYGTSLTIGLLKRKLERNAKKCNLNVVSAGDTVTLGGISVEFIKVVHSMGGACALAVRTKCGTVFVTGDFKMDNTPIDGKKTDVGRIAEIGAKGVLLMLGESTSVERKGSSTSEKVVGQSLESIFLANTKKRLIIACFASSNYRVQQVLTLAQKYNRKVVLAGKSMKAIVDVASACGELHVPKGVIVDGVGKLLPHETLVLATGSQGEPLSALKKMSKGEFNKINIGTDDVVVLSSSPIPGNEKSVYDVINDLFRKGADVIYDSMNDIHVSGHAYEEELKLMLTLVQPEYFMPVHGEYRHQYKHAQIAKAIGVNSKNIVIPNIGESYGVTAKGIRKHSNVPAGNMYVDGVVLEDGQSLVNDRLSLAEYGMLVVLAAVDLNRGVIVGDVDVVARGFNLTADVEKAIRLAVVEGVNSADLDKADIDEYARYVKKSVRKLFYRERQFPIIIPVIVKD
ncbi:MAG: ribonuclease J [[Eubacterium] siraeum]|nr:ribonuclease J [[Eubacterium] siraeum]